ncbi:MULTISPECIES: hypothetical protein [Pseudomonas]|nr:hypothetical protein [Pseudomonas sputi]
MSFEDISAGIDIPDDFSQFWISTPFSLGLNGRGEFSGIFSVRCSPEG